MEGRFMRRKYEPSSFPHQGLNQTFTGTLCCGRAESRSLDRQGIPQITVKSQSLFFFNHSGKKYIHNTKLTFLASFKHAVQ